MPKKATQVRKVEQKSFVNIYKEFILQVAQLGYHYVMVMYNDNSGTYYSSGAKYQEIEQYLKKYMKLGAINTGGEKPKAYLRKWEKQIAKQQEGKLWLIYVDNTDIYKGQNMLYLVDEAEMITKKNAVRPILISNGYEVLGVTPLLTKLIRELVNNPNNFT
jgi:hypothetical protein